MTRVTIHIQNHGEHVVIRLYRQGSRKTTSIASKVLYRHNVGTIIHDYKDLFLQKANTMMQSNRKWTLRFIDDLNGQYH